MKRIKHVKFLMYYLRKSRSVFLQTSKMTDPIFILIKNNFFKTIFFLVKDVVTIFIIISCYVFLFIFICLFPLFVIYARLWRHQSLLKN